MAFFTDADFVQHLAGPALSLGVAHAVEHEGDRGIFDRRQRWDEVELLKDEPDVLASEARNFSILHMAEVFIEDIDDALSLHRTAAGTLELGVHIADVSAFVRPGSPADLEARARYENLWRPPSARLMLIHATVAPVAGGRRCCRGTTVYLADRRFNMLPAVLSEDLCSLRGGQDRFAGTARHPPLQASSAAPCSASSVVTDLRMRGM